MEKEQENGVRLDDVIAMVWSGACLKVHFRYNSTSINFIGNSAHELFAKWKKFLGGNGSEECACVPALQNSGTEMKSFD